MKGLRQNGFAENTLVIVSSDNGPEVPTVRAMRRDHGHDGARPWRGVKRDNWEGGHRIPMIAWWPGQIEAGSISEATISLTDVMATIAEIVGFALPEDAAEDSFSFLPLLLGKAEQTRTFTMHQTIRLDLAIRKGKWKYLDHRGSGGNDYSRDDPWGMAPYALPEQAPDAPGQLYDLENDPGETTNLYFEHPERVEELKTQLELFKSSGRSAPLSR